MKKIYFIIPLALAVFGLILPLTISPENQLMVVRSDSMEPTFHKYDLLIVIESSIDELQPGDIIGFNTYIEGVGKIAHRIESISEVSGEFIVQTKGDNHAEIDDWTVIGNDIIGKVDYSIPIIGLLIKQSPRYALITLIVIMSILLAREVFMGKKLEVKQLTCTRCGYKWYPRIIEGSVKIPDTCPNKDCRSQFWQTKR